MPFAPSSPIRLYASRRSRNPLNIGRAITTAIPDVEAGVVEDLSFSSNLQSSSGLASPISAPNKEDQHSSWSANEESKHRRSVSESLRRNSKDVDRPLSMQEALAMDTRNEGPAAHESLSQVAAKRASTLFDNISESEYSVEYDMAPVVGRASSVRVSKPQIVANRPTKIPVTSGQQVGHSRSSSGSSLKVERDSDNHAGVLPTMHEEPSQDNFAWTIRHVESEALNPTQGVDEANSSSSAPVGLGIRNADDGRSSHDLALPVGNTLHSLRSSIGQSEDTPVTTTSEPRVTSTEEQDIAASKTLMSLGKGLSRRVTIRPADLVTKNHHDHSAFRESIVTTPYPSRKSGEDNSIDLAQNKFTNPVERTSRTLKNTKRASYPYSPGITDRFPSPERPERLFLVLRLHNHPDAHATMEIEIRDRTTFDDEALFEQIKAAYQQQLLKRQRRAFSLIRKISHVTVTGTSQSMNRHYPTFDNTNFLQHLHNPQVGRKRKTWLLWLRNHNNNDNQATFPTSARLISQGPQVRHIDNLTRLSTRSRSAPHSRQSSAGTKTSQSRDEQDITTTANTNADVIVDGSTEKRLSTASDASSFYFAYSPAIPKLPFLSARHNNTSVHDPSSLTGDVEVNTHPQFQPQPQSPAPGRSLFWPSTPHRLSLSLRNHHHHRRQRQRQCPSDPESQSHLAQGHPTLTLHSTHRPIPLLLLFTLNILVSLLIAVMWIIFGVPGTRPGGARGRQDTILVGGDVAVAVERTSDWKVDVQGRVGTGVVLGFVAFVAGVLVEVGVVWMGERVL